MALQTVVFKCLPFLSFTVRTRLFPEGLHSLVGLGVFVSLSAAIGGAQKFLQDNPGASVRIEGILSTGRPGVIWRKGE